ncbi:GtrA family protein [Paralcaligenes sp. KSB-10]|uniref:GtrA family protein n=1 Tax=Paralcaligenes sp. KSB-10 TaxID=2901142 RepID=UPI001E4F45E2|nr:GtrA family protein [Paralcaligenes sp. KSB-10]UHL62652.1 GtrA family protein [Paralcaligenes sp. KSB-10]
MRKIIRQLSWFVAVGCAAAATHWLIAVLTVRFLGYAPLIANVIGWLVAFCVSFAGHYQFTFKHQRAPLAKAARRFFMVSALGFSVNEIAYAYLLRATTVRYDILLALILIAIAAMTFILGRFWAFRHKT